ncbi:solute carrier organic anion transporter family member 1C1-like [Gastrophryne carolinensis]
MPEMFPINWEKESGIIPGSAAAGPPTYKSRPRPPAAPRLVAIGSAAPTYLAQVFLAAMCFVYFAKALAGSYLKSTITQMERRFNLPSAMVGIVDGSFEIGNLLLIAPASFLGAKLHRPKLIAGGCLLMSAGTFLMALPHFLMGRYMYEDPQTYPPNATTNSSPCLQPPSHQLTHTAACDQDTGSSLWLCALLGNLLRGVGEAPIQPLGMSYVDDYAGEDNAALYIGCIQTAAVIGPIFGFLLGSLCASVFVDVGSVDLDRVAITPRDASWVGAWWLGYLVAGAISLVAAIPFWFLPRAQTHPETRKNSRTPSEHSKFILEEPRDPKTVPEEAWPLTLTKDLLPSLKDLLANPVFFFYLCGSVFQSNSLVGMVTYKAKYMEQQYGQTTSRTNFIIGLINIPAVALGIFSGGLVMKKFRICIVGAAKLLLVSAVIGYLMVMSLLAMGCQRLAVAGLTVPYDGVSSNSSAASECNSQCQCVGGAWEPVCGDNGVTYSSACHAGCRSSNGSGQTAVYDRCSCVSWSGSRGHSAVAGPCSRGRSCSRRFLSFVVMSVVTSFTLSLTGTPGYFILLRCTRPELKSLALGIYTLVVRVLAGVPAPIYLGALIDTVCLRRAQHKCNRRGACLHYNTQQFRFLYLGVTGALGLVFIFFSSVVLFILRKLRPPDGSHAPCGESSSSATPSNIGGNVHLLRDKCWVQKETRI